MTLFFKFPCVTHLSLSAYEAVRGTHTDTGGSLILAEDELAYFAIGELRVAIYGLEPAMTAVSSSIKAVSRYGVTHL